jgi:predicted MFS family arabinose efflux permease
VRAAPSVLIVILGIATGALIANVYYAQPLVGLIGPALGINQTVAGSIVSITQIAYGTGLFFLVSLADVVENKTLVLTLVGITALGLVGAALTTGALLFFLTAFVIGLCSTGAQILLPFTAHLVPPERRGRVVGNVMAGVLTGIMVARPLSLFIAGALGWRAVFLWSTCLMVGIGLSLARMMPRYHPTAGLRYPEVLASMARLARERPPVLWRALYQALLFAGFNLFWTAAPLMLAQRFGLDAQEIALFALAGAGGALAAPFAGRAADRGRGTIATVGAMVTLGVCFVATAAAVQVGSLLLLVALAILIDAAVQTNQVVSQRVIYAVPPDIRGRVNAVYMTISFIGGALGSMASTVTLHTGGWTLTATVGGLIGATALALLAIEHRGRHRHA